MKSFLKYSLLLSLVASGVAFAQPEKKADEKPVTPARSLFDIPATPHDGRDPFFPDSTRGYAVATTNAATEVSALAIRGFSGTSGNRMVIINNHTFGVGDESDVLTPSGRVHVHCLAIKPNSVVVEANGQRRELIFSTH